MTPPDWLFCAIGGLLAAGGVVLLVWALFWDRSRGRRRCAKCWYDMAGTPAESSGGFTCPECGRVAVRERALLRTRRRWRWAAVGAAVVLVGITVGVGRDTVTGRALSYVPKPVLRVVLWACDAQAEAAYKSAGPAVRMGRSPGTLWQRLLIARHISVKLREPEDATSAAAGQAVTTYSAVAGGESVTTYGGFPGARAWSYLSELESLGADAWPALPEIVGFIDDGGSICQSQACSVAGEMGANGRPALPALRRLVDQGNQPAAEATAKVLEAVKDVRALRGFLAHRAAFMRAAAVRSLGNLKRSASDATEDLVALGADRGIHPQVLAQAVGAVADDPGLALATLLDTAGAGRRWGAAQVLAGLGRAAAPAIPALLRHAPDADADEAPPMVKAIANASESPAGELTGLLDSPSGVTRRAAAKELGDLGPRMSEPARQRLARGLREDRAASVRVECASALRRGAWDWAETMPALAGAVEDTDASVRYYAATALRDRPDWCALIAGRLGDRARIEPEENVRFALVESVARATPGTPAAVDAVAVLLAHPTSSTVVWAMQTLGSWGAASARAAAAIRAAREAAPDVVGAAADAALLAIEGGDGTGVETNPEAPR